jgi:hypothetical protein
MVRKHQTRNLDAANGPQARDEKSSEAKMAKADFDKIKAGLDDAISR